MVGIILLDQFRESGRLHHADHQPLAERAQGCSKRRQFGRVFGIENAAHFLLVFADATRQFTFGNSGSGKRFEHRELGGGEPEINVDRNYLN